MAIKSDSFLIFKTLPKHKFVLGNRYVSRVICKVTEKSNVLRAVNKLCLWLSVKDSVGSNIIGGELYISLYLEQNSPLVYYSTQLLHVP